MKKKLLTGILSLMIMIGGLLFHDVKEMQMVFYNKGGNYFHQSEYCEHLFSHKKESMRILCELLGYKECPYCFHQESYTLEGVPSFNGKAYVTIHDNKPFFNKEDYSKGNFEEYSSLDHLGRVQKAFINASMSTLPKEKRKSIGMVKPTGWHQRRYEEIRDSDNPAGYLYNRCHLIAYEIGAENANRKNLMTGTRYLNIKGMLPWENKVATYIKRTAHHVLYRVTPIYKDNQLLAKGVLLEGKSVEDQEIQFCVYCYNVQPGITIHYEDGTSEVK
jgi:DNA-entry nuclease